MPYKGRSAERRWIVLGEDGRFVTLGRDSDPTAEEISGAESALIERGLSGWLAIMEGNPYIGTLPRLFEVRPLANPRAIFEDAAQACVSAISEQRSTRKV